MDNTLTDFPLGYPGAGPESERTKRLRSLGLNDPSPDESFDRFARLAASITDAPIAFVNFINDERQMFRGLYIPPPEGQDAGPVDVESGISFDMPSREMPTNYGFCPHVVAQRAPLALDDVLAYPRYEGNPVVNEFGIRSYLGAPLVDDYGTVLGTVCVVDREPRQWGRDRMHDMQRLAQALLSEIRLRDSLMTQQQEMLSAFDRSPLPVMLTEGSEQQVRYANDQHVAVFGEPTGHVPGAQDFPSLSSAGLFNAVAEVFRTGSPVAMEGVKIPGGRTGGADRYFTFNCSPLRLPQSGTVNGVLTVGLDVTTQTQTEQELGTLATLLVERLQRSGRPAGTPGTLGTGSYR